MQLGFALGLWILGLSLHGALSPFSWPAHRAGTKVYPRWACDVSALPSLIALPRPGVAARYSRGFEAYAAVGHVKTMATMNGGTYQQLTPFVDLSLP